MKLMCKTVLILMCSGIVALAPQPIGGGAPVAAASMAKGKLSDQWENLPPGVRETVEETIDFFGLHDTSLDVYTRQSGSNEWQVTLRLNQDEDQEASQPDQLDLLVSVNSGKLNRLDVSWGRELEERTPDKGVAVDAASDFSRNVLGEGHHIAKNPALFHSSMIEVPLYTTVNNIPVQKPVAKVIVNANGDVHRFQRLDVEIDERDFPRATGLLSAEEAKQRIGETLEMELVYDDKRHAFQYIPRQHGWIDAKTGAFSPGTYQYREETFPVTEDQEKTAASPDDVKQLATSCLGLGQQSLILSTGRSSHPGEASETVYKLKDGISEYVIRVDEETGTLLSLQAATPGIRQEVEPLSHAEAKQSALDCIDRYIPLKKGEYLLRERHLAEQIPDWVKKSDLPAEYQVDLYPLIGDVRMADPSVSITIDLANSRIVSVTTRATQPGPNTVPAFISFARAKQEWLDSLQLELQYVYPRFLYQASEQPVLAYIPAFAEESRYIDAVSGEVGGS